MQGRMHKIVGIWELERSAQRSKCGIRNSEFSAPLPMNPMHGTVGVAPANLEVRSALVPDAFGGNMDTPQMRAGVTCYLGVNVAGAPLSPVDGPAPPGGGGARGVAVRNARDTTIAAHPVQSRAR